MLRNVNIVFADAAIYSPLKRYGTFENFSFGIHWCDLVQPLSLMHTYLYIQSTDTWSTCGPMQLGHERGGCQLV